MIQKTHVVNLTPQVRLHLIHSEKFKTDLLSVSLARPLTAHEAVHNTLVTRVLERGTEKYPTFTQLSSRLDELYGAILVADATKFGEKHVIDFKMQYLNAKHLGGNDLLAEALEVLDEIMFRPLFVAGVFNADFVAQEVQNLKDEIAARVNDKIQYGIEKCIETMCADEPYHVHQFGDLETLETVTPQSLTAHYKEVMTNSFVDVVVIGDIDFNAVENRMRLQFPMKGQTQVNLPNEVFVPSVSEAKRYSEHYPIQQEKIAIGYRTGIQYTDEAYESSAVMSQILGGGANSLLFQNVREKESLCYYIFSSLEKYKGIMLIGAGIEATNTEKTLDLIDFYVEEMKAGNFTDSDLQLAKKSIVSSVDAISDYPNSFVNYYYSFALFNKKFDLGAFKTRIESVTHEDVVEAAKKLSKDTTYLMQEADNNETD